MAVLRTPEGYLRIPAKISRTGIQDYLAIELRNAGVPLADSIPDNAIVKIYRDAAEVFNADALSSFEHKPTTLGHPVGFVTPENVRQLQTGFTLSPVTVKDNHVAVDILLQDAEAIKAYNAGMRDLSCGYKAGVMMTPGMTADGQPFDGKQVSIVGNHVAQLPAGRAGTAKLGDTVATKGKSMNDEEKKALKDTQEALAELRALVADADAVRKERDRLAGEVEALKGQLISDEEIQKKIDDGVAAGLQAIEERKAIVDRARKFAPKMEVADADTVRDIQIKAIQARKSGIDFADKSDEFVSGMFASLSEPTGGSMTTLLRPTTDGSTNRRVTYQAIQAARKGK